MTTGQAKQLKAGDWVIFCFTDGREISGKVTKINKEFVAIEWGDGYPGVYAYDAMNQIQMENVS